VRVLSVRKMRITFAVVLMAMVLSAKGQDQRLPATEDKNNPESTPLVLPGQSDTLSRTSNSRTTANRKETGVVDVNAMGEIRILYDKNGTTPDIDIGTIVKMFSFMLAVVTGVATLFSAYMGYTRWEAKQEYKDEVKRAEDARKRAEDAWMQADDAQRRAEKVVAGLEETSRQTTDRFKQMAEEIIQKAIGTFRRQAEQISYSKLGIGMYLSRCRENSLRIRRSNDAAEIQAMATDERDLLNVVLSNLQNAEQGRADMSREECDLFIAEVLDIKLDIEAIHEEFVGEVKDLIILCDKVIATLKRLQQRLTRAQQ
jgi:hypothetical protein